VGQRGRSRILLIADRPSVRRQVARRLVEAGHVQVVSTIAEAISIVVLDRPTCVVFDSHLAGSQGTHAVSALLRILETYRLPAVDFAVHGAAGGDGLTGAGQPAPLRPRPQLPYLQAEAEPPNESVG